MSSINWEKDIIKKVASHIQNYNCDGEWCTSANGEVRRLETSGSAGIHLCKDCYKHEMEWRKGRNEDLEESAKFDLPAWEDLEKVVGKEASLNKKAEATPEIKERLEYLRKEILNERISYEEIAELESLKEYIELGDVLLLEWAGVPEFPEDNKEASAKKVEVKEAAKQVPVTVYEFKELSLEAKKKAMDEWYEIEAQEGIPGLEEDMDIKANELLQEHGIINEKGDLKVNYSLGHSQGDGAMFIGTFKYKSIMVKVTHGDMHYSHANTATFYFYDENYEDIDESDEMYSKIVDEFKSIYKDICKKLERWGYDIVEYRMSDAEFSEQSDANGYNFDINGKMVNL